MVYNVYKKNTFQTACFMIIFCYIILFLYFKFIFDFHIISNALLLGMGIVCIILGIVWFCANFKYSVDIENRKIILPKEMVRRETSFLKKLLDFFYCCFV